MRAQKRQVLAKVVIDYTDPLIDQSIQVDASERARISWPEQTADGLTQAPYMWASLDGSWTLDQFRRPMPDTEELADLYQVGWWGEQIAGIGGAFAEPYPTLTVTHTPRPVHSLKVVGENQFSEYPVDFTIRLRDGLGVLLHEEIVTGNDSLTWSKVLEAPILDVVSQELEIHKWSREGRQVKILEFFSSVQQTHEDDLIAVSLLEEREVSQGSLPVGNISSNELVVRLSNEDRRFDPDNDSSPLYGLIKPNRRVRAWLGIRGAGDLWGDGWYAPFDRDLAVARRDEAVQEPLPGYVATLRPGEGRFGGAVAVEEGTINLGTEEDILNWPGITQGEDEDGKYYQYTSGSVYNRDLFPSINFLPDTQYTLSFIAKRVTGANPRFRIYHTDGTYIEAFYNSPDLTYRSITSAPGKTVDRISHVYSSFGSNRLYKIQIEQKPFATSFVDGTRAAGRLEYPAEVVPQNEGTIAGWFKMHPLGFAEYRYFWDSIGYRFAFYIRSSDKSLIARTHNSAERNFGSLGSGFDEAEWHQYALTWTGLGLNAYVDGELVGSYNGTIELPLNSGNVRFGTHRSGFDERSIGLIDELLILPYAASEEHIARLYAQTRPLYDEWVPLGVFWSTDWDSEELEAMVRARDHMELLRRTTYEPGPLKQNVSLYELAQDVLTHAKMPPETYWLDPELQDIVVPWGWVPPGSHRDALRIIAEAALAVVYADRDGVVRIETLGSVPATPVVEITGDDYFPPLRAPSRQDQVANEIVVATQPLRPEDEPQQVYRSTTPITVPAGQTVTVQVRYNQPPVIEAQATLDNQPPGVSIVAATYYAWGAGITLQNSGATQADVSLVVTGRPLSVQGGEQAVARDQTSITENGVLRYEYPNNPLVQTLDQAQAIAQALLASAKDSRRDIEVEWRGNPALELGDPIAVVTDAERDRRSEYAVIRQELDWAGYLRARLAGRRI